MADFEDRIQRNECEHCSEIVDRANVPHIVRQCKHCGREMRIVDPGENGKGLRISQGDRLVIPANWLSLSFNPLKGRGQFSREGLAWFARFIFLGPHLVKEEAYQEEAETLEQQMDELVNQSPLVKPLDINKPGDNEAIWAVLQDRSNLSEYWALLTGQFLAIARSAREEGDAVRAAWATSAAERCRTILLFKEHLEEVVWMGHSVRRLVEVLQIWEGNQDNKEEEFWQQLLKEHSYVLAQIFAVPVVFIQEKAFVGGMKLDRNDSKFVDYLFSAETSHEAILVEIKTPASRLLGGQYRKGVYGPSAELSGAIVQVLAYRAELRKNLHSLIEGTSHSLKTFNPRCVLLLGNGKSQLSDSDARTSFELFRSSSEVEIITYDELFRKVELLAELFRLKRTS